MARARREIGSMGVAAYNRGTALIRRMLDPHPHWPQETPPEWFTVSIQLSPYDVLLAAKRMTRPDGYTWGNRPTSNKGADILDRARTYLEYGELGSPGWSTKQFDPPIAESRRTDPVW